MTKRRIEWVDIVKFICINFVMISHFESSTKLLGVFFEPFFLTAFFFVSGYVYNDKDKFGDFFIKKVRGLFVPWLVFSVFNILLSQVMSFGEKESLVEALKWNFLQIRGLDDGLWFIAAIFVAFIPFFFLIRWSNKPSQKGYDKGIFALLISLLLSVISITYTKLMNPQSLPWNTVGLPWHLEFVFQAMFFMVLGYFFKMRFETVFDKLNNVKNRALCWCAYLIIIYVPYFSGLEFSGVWGVIYGYICELLGIVAVVSLCKSVKTNPFIAYGGQNTIIYFALHGKVFSVIQVIIKKLAGGVYGAILSNEVSAAIFSVVFALVLSVILIIPSYIINRWLPFLVGRKK